MKKLHQLLHSLSQSEKRFLKIRLKGSKSNSNLVTHFDFLCKQKKYSFEEILKAGGKTVKLTQSNLSLLFDVVLKHLRSHHSTKSIEHNLRGNLSDIKTLMNKGLVDEAKINCLKLIEHSSRYEEFEVLTASYKELWNIYLLKGEINSKNTISIQIDLKKALQKEAEIIFLEEIYRDATTIYYDYFFHKRDVKFHSKIKELTTKLVDYPITSAKAKHVYYEVKAIEYVILGLIDKHHQSRQQQLLHLISSEVFSQDGLHRLLVLSNVFIFLKSKASINELKAYLNFMEDFFQPELDKKSDSVFMEKYYDIYFLNQCFLLVWAPDSEKISEITELFKTVIAKNYLSNHILIGRIYLSIIELYILTADYKAAIPLLVDFFNLSRKNKLSKLYIEGDLHFLVANYLMGKMDTFENSLEALNRKIRRNEIDLNVDENALLELLNSALKEKLKDVDYYVNKMSHRQTYKIYVYKLLTKDSVEIIRLKYFPINDLTYIQEKDDLLLSLKRFVNS